MSRKIFINLAVSDLSQSMAFFTTLGFEFNPNFTNDKGAAMVISEDASVMLLSREFFATFTNKAIGDTSSQTESILALACSSRAEVDTLVEKALESGGTAAMEPQDHGFMYGRSFYDPDGHHWEAFWMDDAAQPAVEGGQ